MTQPDSVLSPRNPRGFQVSKVDAAGRMKLPSKYQDFLKLLTDRTLFATMFEGMARIYCNGSLERNLSRLEGDPEAYEWASKTADKFGGDVDLDPQGRITLPQLLRKTLELTDQSVYLRMQDDIITVYNEAQYNALSEKLDADEEKMLARSRSLGFRL